jgi:hypothetical protein
VGAWGGQPPSAIRTFRLSAFEDRKSVRAEIESAELALILEGIELAGAKRSPRFRLNRSA